MNIPEKIALIKTRMPETYQAIQDKAKVIGNDAFALVKRGLRGEPNCFWAMEAGNVVGTPFNHTEISRDVAQAMVTFGCAYVCIFAMVEGEARNGAN
jgi:hypothetical protein